MKPQKEIIEKDELRKKIVGFLADYKYNDTRTETTEMFADKLINIIYQSKENDEIEFISYVLLGDGYTSKYYTKMLKQRLSKLNSQQNKTEMISGKGCKAVNTHFDEQAQTGSVDDVQKLSGDEK